MPSHPPTHPHSTHSACNASSSRLRTLYALYALYAYIGKGGREGGRYICCIKGVYTGRLTACVGRLERTRSKARINTRITRRGFCSVPPVFRACKELGQGRNRSRTNQRTNGIYLPKEVSEPCCIGRGLISNNWFILCFLSLEN